MKLIECFKLKLISKEKKKECKVRGIEDEIKLGYYTGNIYIILYINTYYLLVTVKKK